MLLSYDFYSERHLKSQTNVTNVNLQTSPSQTHAISCARPLVIICFWLLISMLSACWAILAHHPNYLNYCLLFTSLILVNYCLMCTSLMIVNYCLSDTSDDDDDDSGVCPPVRCWGSAPKVSQRGRCLLSEAKPDDIYLHRWCLWIRPQAGSILHFTYEWDESKSLLCDKPDTDCNSLTFSIRFSDKTVREHWGYSQGVKSENAFEKMPPSGAFNIIFLKRRWSSAHYIGHGFA